VVVVLLLVVIWTAVLVPPAVRSNRLRRGAFEISFGRPPSGRRGPAPSTEVSRGLSSAVRRRRRIAGSLLIAMVATGLAGLVPRFRLLLVVHLFAVDSLLFYVALLAHGADRRARRGNGEAMTSPSDLTGYRGDTTRKPRSLAPAAIRP